ncbi:PilZ domain-containing protein [Bacillus sp. B15-48]|uniref:PilZ domain-containing protein n=1 Tax=Bacillus sp. B15-48 TaxID=1548601 RepID=UPI0019401DEE|nr:PilZ domain-containing protein [Bacillus sp. B15-48]MBM4764117.1 hypothetical protein [Bacillus sp. B15-48]
MVYAVLIFSIIVVLILLYFFKILKNNQSAGDSALTKLSNNRREHFRLKFNDTFCNFQPLVTPSNHLGAIRDISAGGIRIETSTNELDKGSLLMLYFEINNETFIFEGIVKRKVEIAPNVIQYGVKFISSTIAQQDKLYRKLRALERQQTHAQ